ncbi:MAG: sigma-70 family RNA polymerase sigma factor [Crocosphaera sp.]
MLADNPANATETDLVLRCQQGDTLSFKQLYRRYEQRVRATLYQLCGSEMLDDLVQEVFLRVWKSLPKLRKASYFSTWLYRITWNVATDKRRKFAQNLSVNDDGSILNIMPSRPADTPDLMRLHYQDLVQQGLETLSLEHRAVLVLHDLEDVPQKEVANILNLPVGTVKSRLFYARNQMRKFLKQQGAL